MIQLIVNPLRLPEDIHLESGRWNSLIHRIKNAAVILYPKNLKNRFFGLSESSLESTTAGFANWSVLMQYEPNCDRRL